MEVYTGYGDKGMTDLSHTKNVSKSDDRICLMGSVEELMSHIGLVRVLVDDVDVVRMLEKISETLKKIIDGVSDPYNREFKVSEDRTEFLEEEIGRMKEIFSGERLPILPGDSRVAAEIDVTRAVARRAERACAGQCEVWIGYRSQEIYEPSVRLFLCAGKVCGCCEDRREEDRYFWKCSEICESRDCWD